MAQSDLQSFLVNKKGVKPVKNTPLTGSWISFAAIGTACICAECIPVMIGAISIAALDIGLAYFKPILKKWQRKSRLVRTNHKTAAQICAKI